MRFQINNQCLVDNNSASRYSLDTTLIASPEEAHAAAPAIEHRGGYAIARGNAGPEFRSSPREFGAVDMQPAG